MAGTYGPIARVERAGARLLLVGALVAFVAMAPSEARAGDEQELESARLRLAGGQLADAAARLAVMLDPSVAVCKPGPDVSPQGCRVTDPELVQRARGYYAIALVALGREPEAKAQIDAMLEQDPAFQPNPAAFPQKVIDIIIGEQARLAEKLAKIAADRAARERADRVKAAGEAKAQADYIRALELAASKETVIETHSRWIAAIPMGVGQFQNDNIGLGVLFASTEGVAIVATIVTAGLAADLRSKAIAATNPDPCANATGVSTACPTGATSSATATPAGQKFDFAATNQQINALQIASGVSLATLGVVTIAGIIEAEASYKKSIVTRRDRPLPPKPKVNVTGVPGASSATGIGLQVNF